MAFTASLPPLWRQAAQTLEKHEGKGLRGQGTIPPGPVLVIKVNEVAEPQRGSSVQTRDDR